MSKGANPTSERVSQQTLLGLAQDLFEVLKRQKQTIAFAESCTGGQLSGTMARVNGVSEVFLGSIISYSYQAKEDLLSVSSEILKNHGAVSSEVARQMAYGVRKQLKSDWALAITGIAGPAGGTTQKPVGTVYFACLGPGFEEAKVEHQLFSGTREEVQAASVNFALQLVLENNRLLVKKNK